MQEDCKAKEAEFEVIDSEIKQITAEMHGSSAEVAGPYDNKIAAKKVELADLENLRKAKIIAACAALVSAVDGLKIQRDEQAKNLGG